jgi:hypothetical protein
MKLVHSRLTMVRRVPLGMANSFANIQYWQALFIGPMTE